MPSRSAARWGRAAGLLALAALAWLGPGAARTAQDADSEALRATMDRIFDGLRQVLPLAVSERYRDPGNRSRIHPALEDLARNADVLSKHGKGRDAGFGFLGRSLADDTREILSAYEADDFERSQFLLRQVTENCVACHARLPSGEAPPLTERFVEGTTLAGLEPEDRATILIATRRFDEALATLEKLLAWPAVHPADLLSPLTDYLVISIRVKGDLERPVPVLRKFAARPDLWRHLRLDVERWIADLEALRTRSLPDDLATAKRLLDEARGMITFPADRSALVHYVMASGILNRLIEARTGDPDARPAEVAEAYYLLGLVESRIGRNFWVNPSGLYLETAIRLAPREPFAEQAYALLEEEVILGYSGSAGISLPDDVERNLHELRHLIDAP